MFRILPNGSGFETVHSFRSVDAAYPSGELIEHAGSLYGMTSEGGGAFQHSGTIFRVDLANPSGVQVVHVFGFEAGNAAFPVGGLVR